MYQPNKSKTVETLVQAARERTGTRFVPADTSGLRAQLSILKTGGIIGAMPDQEPDVHSGEFAGYFGQPALTATTVPGMARKTGAACFVAYCKRLAHGAGFKLMIAPADISAGPDALNAALERAVRACPEQYLWSYKRFRTRPEGEAELYQFPAGLAFARPEAMLLAFVQRLVAAAPAGFRNAVTYLLHLAIRSRAGKHVRVTRRNLEATGLNKDGDLAARSLHNLARIAVDTARTWYSSDAAFNHRLERIHGDEYLANGAIVMTPPLGQREAVFRYLGARYRTTEYYHPASRAGLDLAIRKARTAMGVALVPHTNQGVRHLMRRLEGGEVVTLCPDQQPRLRGGDFIPFFGVPALTSRAIAALVGTGDVPLVFGIALQRGDALALHFEPCPVSPGGSTADILLAVNQALENIIIHHLDEYRWSDKRFNIQPPGEPRFYR